MPHTQYYQEALSSVTQGILLIDRNGPIVFANRSFRDMLAVDDALVEFGTPTVILHRALARRGEYGVGDPEAHVEARESAIASGVTYQFERQRPNGRFLSITGNPIKEGGYIYTLTDVTDRELEQQRLAAEVAKKTRELRKANRELGRLASIDPLLGISNRRRIISISHTVYEKMVQVQKRSTVLMIDVDHFKDINDRYGHAAGDIVLSSIVMGIRGNLRRDNHLARYGGEEFIALLPMTNLEEALLLAETIRSSVAAHVVLIGGESISVTISVGIAAWEIDEPIIEIPLTRADDALYSAKRAGRNRCHFQDIEAVTLSQDS